ncbi:formylglycine-generating enzyme family protein [Enterovibrio sp. ZSDZ35]|uniref:Formylglycine-generating enzyme family protein n=1 Tax=Enterovibrio qingdaonensis TaxID=2899818 RepID=A0ABT5QJD6_9GAMM|nr:SUMF1/EgtB/PvdO family nonheme iron enzyme [Enterovibrio sp. ZSDZ35]MDD1781103.1 formylglycine-generating enzyme family protein [Enterovibrio sp. ZSDZ35]
MKLKNILVFLVPIIASCGDANSTLPITSDVVSKDKIAEIQENIERLYPESEESLRKDIFEVAVRAIEDMVFVEGGTFMMGDFKAPCDPVSTERMDWTPDAKCFSTLSSLESGAKFLHKVTLDSYYLSKYEAQLFDVDVYLHSLGLPFINGGREFLRDGDVFLKIKRKLQAYSARISGWDDAKNYCVWLGEITRLPFDLPSEAQWEYAARSRGENVYYATNNGYLQRKGGHYYDPEAGFYVDYKKEEWNYYSDERKVGAWPPNPLGIYDMTGGRREWVNDWFSVDYYKISPEYNPVGPEAGSMKTMRAGKTMTRFGVDPTTEIKVNGFRCSIQSSIL